MHRLLLSVLTLGCMLLPAAAHAAQDAAGCASVKLKAAATSALSQLKCHATAARKNVAVDAACIDKAKSKLRTAVDRADAHGGCATTGDGAAYEAQVDDFVAAIVGTSPCADQLKAAGTAASSVLKCYATAAKKSDPTDGACLDKADDKLASAFAKAQTRGCPAVSTSAVQADVHALAESLACAAPASSVRIFSGWSAPSGALGDRAATDAQCAAAATSQGLVCNEVVALLSYSGDTIADFPATRCMPRTAPLIAGAANRTIASSWADFLDGTWQTCLGPGPCGSGPNPIPPAAAILTSYEVLWTGSSSDGSLASNCNDWSDGTDGSQGASSLIGDCYGVFDHSLGCAPGQTLDAGVGFCSEAHRVACLCY